MVKKNTTSKQQKKNHENLPITCLKLDKHESSKYRHLINGEAFKSLTFDLSTVDGKTRKYSNILDENDAAGSIYWTEH